MIDRARPSNIYTWRTNEGELVIDLIGRPEAHSGGSLYSEIVCGVVLDDHHENVLLVAILSGGLNARRP